MLAPFALVAALGLLQDAPAGSITKLHEIGDLLALHGGTLRLDLCPEQSSGRPEEMPKSETLPLLEAESLRDAMQELLRAEAGDTVGRIVLEESALSFEAPAEVHARVDRWLEGLRAALHTQERIEVRAVTGVAPGDAPLLLEAEDAERRERELADSGRGSVRRLGATTLVDGRAATIEDVTEESFVRDYDVQIAHGSAIYDPVVGVNTLGLTASVRAARLPGATWLDLAVRYADPAQPLRERVVRPMLWLSSPLPLRSEDADTQGDKGKEAQGGTALHEPVPLRLEFPTTRFLSLAGSFVVPDGKALWIPCQVATHAGPVSLLLDVRVRGPYRADAQPLESSGTTGLVLFHGGASVSGGFALPEMLESSLSSVTKGDRSETWWPSLAVESEPASRPFDTLLATLPASARSAGADVLQISDGQFLLRAPVPMLDSLLRSWRSLVAPRATFELHGRITRNGSPLAEFRLPAVSGRVASIWSGIAGAHLATWDVDVAGESMIGNPDVGWYLDGFALSFVVNASDSSPLRVTARGVLNFLDGPPTDKELGNPYTPFIENLEAERIYFSETRAVSSGDGIRFGETPLALELSLKRT